MPKAWTLRGFAVAALTTGCPNDDPPAGDETESAASETTPTDPSATDPSTSTTTPSEESSSSGGEEESSSSGTPTGDCGEGRVCLGRPPLGWVGPVVIAKGEVADALPDCADPYPGNELTRLEGFVEPGPAECECSCSLAPGGCYMYTYSESAEFSPGYCYYHYTQASEGCNELPEPLENGQLYAYSYPNFGAAACDQEANETLPEIPWDAIAKGCTGGYTDEACGDDGFSVCYNKPAAPFEQQICYLAQGDQIPCPPDTDYQERTIRYSAVEDNRNCTSCACGQLDYCLDQYEYFTTPDCSGGAAGTIGNSLCVDNITAMAVNFDLSGVSCPVQSQAEPEGEATPLDPWTYCCSAPL